MCSSDLTKNVGLLKVSGCRIYGNNKIYRGVSILSGTMCEISDCYIDNCIGPSIFLMGYPGLEGRTVDIVIRHNRIDGGQGLTSWNYVEGIFCRDNIFCNATPSVNINAEPGKGLVSFKLQDNDFDTSKNIGVYIDNIANIQITGCWFSNLESGLVIGEAAHSLIVSSNQMYCRGNHGSYFRARRRSDPGGPDY